MCINRPNLKQETDISIDSLHLLNTYLFLDLDLTFNKIVTWEVENKDTLLLTSRQTCYQENITGKVYIIYAWTLCSKIVSNTIFSRISLLGKKVGTDYRQIHNKHGNWYNL